MKGRPGDSGIPARLASETTAHRGMTRRTMVAGSALATVAGGLVAWQGTDTAEAAAAGGPGPTFAHRGSGDEAHGHGRPGNGFYVWGSCLRKSRMSELASPGLSSGTR